MLGKWIKSLSNQSLQFSADTAVCSLQGVTSCAHDAGSNSTRGEKRYLGYADKLRHFRRALPESESWEKREPVVSIAGLKLGPASSETVFPAACRPLPVRRCRGSPTRRGLIARRLRSRELVRFARCNVLPGPTGRSMRDARCSWSDNEYQMRSRGWLDIDLYRSAGGLVVSRLSRLNPLSRSPFDDGRISNASPLQKKSADPTESVGIDRDKPCIPNLRIE